jgi:hypothetical protein
MLKWLNLINKIKMLILILELSKFLVVTFKYSRKPSFKVLRQFQRASFSGEDLLDLHTFPIKSYLVGGLFAVKGTP